MNDLIEQKMKEFDKDLGVMFTTNTVPRSLVHKKAKAFLRRAMEEIKEARDKRTRRAYCEICRKFIDVDTGERSS